MGSGESGEKAQQNAEYSGATDQVNSTGIGGGRVMRQDGDGLVPAAAAGGAAGLLASGATGNRSEYSARSIPADTNRGYIIGDMGGASRQVNGDGAARGPDSGVLAGAAMGPTGQADYRDHDHENICHRCGHSLEECDCEEGPLYYYQVTLDRIRSRGNV